MNREKLIALIGELPEAYLSSFYDLAEEIRKDWIQEHYRTFMGILTEKIEDLDFTITDIETLLSGLDTHLNEESSASDRVRSYVRLIQRSTVDLRKQIDSLLEQC